MAKTPARIKILMDQQQEMMRHVTQVLKTKRNVPLASQALWVREHSEDYFIGMAIGYNAMLENALMAHKCYAGFQYQVATSTERFDKPFYENCGPKHPEFAEWRRSYYMKG
jgi:hypothetical protein